MHMDLAECYYSNQDQISALDISLGNFASFTSSNLTSPKAPAFSPITPQHTNTHSPLCTNMGSSTPLQVNPCLVPPSSQGMLLSQPTSPSLGSHSVMPPLYASSPMAAKRVAWSGFKVVIDNIDMTRHQTFERQTKSIHYVNSYAVRDRIDLSSYCTTEVTNTELSVKSLLPTEDDRKCILTNFAVLAARILCESIPALQEIPDLSTRHIIHMHSEEMNSKSDIVRELQIA